MPYPNEHAARVREPGDFKDGSFRRKKITEGVSIIVGKLKEGDGSMVTQAYRFDKDKFSEQAARAWLKENEVKTKSFEPASDKSLKAEMVELFYARGQKVGAAWSASEWGNVGWVVDLDADALLVEMPEGMYRVPYEEGDNGVVVFAPLNEWSPVERQVAYVAKGLGPDLLVVQGGEIKSLGGGKVGGYLVLFSGDQDPDLTGDFFTKDTDFGLGSVPRSGIYYDHGLDPVIGKRRLGEGELRVDDTGVWIEGVLQMRDAYEQAIDQLVHAGKLGWSSGTAPSLIEREDAGKATWIKHWPLGLDASLTPMPAEPRTKAVSLKSYATIGMVDLLRGPEGRGGGDHPEPFSPEQVHLLRMGIRALFEKRRYDHVQR